MSYKVITINHRDGWKGMSIKKLYMAEVNHMSTII